MAKKKEVTEEITDPFIGGEDDDLMDMEYVQDETTSSVDTHPPQTKEEAELLAKGVDPDAVEDPTPVEKAEEPKEEAEEPKEEAVAEEEPEVEAEPEADLKVPKDRFDEVNERMKAAEKQTKELKKQLETVVEQKSEPEPEPDPFDYATKEAEAMDAVLEGDTAKYAAIREEIRLAEKTETLREAKRISTEGDQYLQENMTFEEVGARIEAAFPQFQADSDTFNEEAREEMLDLYVGYAKSGIYSRVDALQRAADRTARIYGFDTKPEPTPDNVVNIKKTDAKAKAKTANQQPPLVESRESTDHEEPRNDIQSMSDEEFEALPESTKRRMRGDIL